MMKVIYVLVFSSILLGCKPKIDPAIYPYLTYLPEGYDATHIEKFPLMVFLHGAGERGEDIQKVKTHGPPKLIAQGDQFPCIVVSPLCPNEVWWDVERLDATLDQVIKDNRVDLSRVYLTGLSMGGYGTFAWAIASPDRFAALAPICGGGDPHKASAIRDHPIWVFHGAKDDVVPLSESQDMVDTLAELDAKVRFTIYPDAKHDSWTETYNNPEFYEWMFSQ